MPTYIVKIDCDDSVAMYDALQDLVEEHDASYYTLVVDGKPLPEWEPHLWVEQAQAEGIAAALAAVTDDYDRLYAEVCARHGRLI
jgi:hypothetical protein